jgi:hypothetical protein
MNVIISDITYMKEKFCVAGFDYFNNRMVRLMPNKSHWEENELKKLGGFSVITVEGEYPKKDEGRNYPHKTEDFWIDENSLRVLRTYENSSELARDLHHSISPTIQDIFSGNVKRKLYVPAKTKCRSLGAIEIVSDNIKFYKDENSKLRVWIKDNDGTEYNIKVSSKLIRDLWMAKDWDTNVLNAILLKPNKKVHVRIGLARAFSLKDNHCYLMCNGLFLM